MAKKKDVEKAFPKTDREERGEFYRLVEQANLK